jgi:uncharacterized protein
VVLTEKQPIRAPLCPICRKLQVEAFRPFCSKHCADVDLSRWFNGVYAVPETDEDEGDGKRPGEARHPDTAFDD